MMAGGEDDDDIIALKSDVIVTQRPASVILVQPAAVADGGDSSDHVVIVSTASLEDMCPEVVRCRDRFETFREAVEQDLAGKLTSLQDYRRRCAANSMRDRNYANIQIFMLSKYAGRLRRFQVICDSQLAELTAQLELGNVADIRTQADRYMRLGKNHLRGEIFI